MFKTAFYHLTNLFHKATDTSAPPSSENIDSPSQADQALPPQSAFEKMTPVEQKAFLTAQLEEDLKASGIYYSTFKEGEDVTFLDQLHTQSDTKKKFFLIRPCNSTPGELDLNLTISTSDNTTDQNLAFVKHKVLVAFLHNGFNYFTSLRLLETLPNNTLNKITPKFNSLEDLIGHFKRQKFEFATQNQPLKAKETINDGNATPFADSHFASHPKVIHELESVVVLK